LAAWLTPQKKQEPARGSPVNPGLGALSVFAFGGLGQSVP
jgi:hypothetical protein